AVTLVLVRAVRALRASKTVTLHHAGKALTPRRATHVHELTIGEHVTEGDLLPGLELRSVGVVAAELAQHDLGAHARLLELTSHWLARVFVTALAEAEHERR